WTPGDRGSSMDLRASELEFDVLGQGKVGGPVDSGGLAAHIGLPRVAAGFTSAPGFLFPSESAADFSAACADVDVGDAAIATPGTQEGFGRYQVGGKHSRRKALRDGVVLVDGVFELVEFDQIENRGENLLIHDRHAGL